MAEVCRDIVEAPSRMTRMVGPPEWGTKEW